MSRLVWVRYGALIFCVAGLLAAILTRIEAAQSFDAAASLETHHPLRQNLIPEKPPAPTEPEVFGGYAGAPPFEVVPREDKLSFYPCTQCHQHMTPNPVPRQLVAAPHPAALRHGGGRMWCLDCHDKDNRAQLHTFDNRQASFNESYLVCGQCHATRQRDWYFGAHGKRLQSWQGDRILYSCTHCHDPHSPSIKPRKPAPPPPVRAGLEAMPDADRNVKGLWQKLVDEGTGDQP
jgi:uncharacterized CHY-type Zn-finger protein